MDKFTLKKKIKEIDMFMVYKYVLIGFTWIRVNMPVEYELWQNDQINWNTFHTNNVFD